MPQKVLWIVSKAATLTSVAYSWVRAKSVECSIPSRNYTKRFIRSLQNFDVEPSPLESPRADG